MAWKTQHGRWLRPGDRVVWVGRKGDHRPPDFRFTGTVKECLPMNDDDDGEVKVIWDAEPPDRNAANWTYPMFLDHVDDVSAIERLAQIKKEI